MISSLPLLIIPFVIDFMVLVFLAIVYGFGFATVTASTSPLISELVPKELTMDVGQTLGPIISGLILATYLQYY